MKISLVLAFAFAASLAINYDAEWEKFKLKYEKNYSLSANEVSHFWFYLDKNDIDGSLIMN